MHAKSAIRFQRRDLPHHVGVSSRGLSSEVSDLRLRDPLQPHPGIPERIDPPQMLHLLPKPRPRCLPRGLLEPVERGLHGRADHVQQIPFGSSSAAVSWSHARRRSRVAQFRSCQAMTGSRGLSRRSSQGGRQSALTWCGDESCVLAVAEGAVTFASAASAMRVSRAGRPRQVSSAVWNATLVAVVPLGGEPLASGRFRPHRRFRRAWRLGGMDLGGDAAGEHCGENESGCGAGAARRVSRRGRPRVRVSS
jgi:hypothetical protein